MVSRTITNLFVDGLLFVSTVLLLWIATVLRFLFPAPTVAAGWALWGWSYDAWSDLQFGLLTILSLIILIHIMLHWSWVCGVAVTKVLGRKKAGADNGSQTIYGVATLIVVLNLIGLLIGLASLTIQPPTGS